MARVSFAPFEKDKDGKFMPVPPAKFVGGRFETEYENTIDRLRKHKANLANGASKGGPHIYFWEEEKSTSDLTAQKEGRLIIGNIPEPISEETNKALMVLAQVANGKMGQLKIINKPIMDAYALVVQEFEILGSIPLMPNTETKRTRPDVTKLLYALDDKQIETGLAA